MNVKTKDGKILKLVGLLVVPSELPKTPDEEVAWCYDRDGKPVKVLIKDIESWGK